jgi:hypothetical protein
MVLKHGAVMSKSKGNVVDPDDMIGKFGADALRLYVMFVAPPEKEVEWTTTGSRALSASSRACGGSSSTWRGRCRRPRRRPAGARRRRNARSPEDARHDSARDVGYRSAHAPEHGHLALMEMVNDLYAFADERGSSPDGRDDERAAVISRPETAAVLREAVRPWCCWSRRSRRTWPRSCGNGWATEGVVAAGGRIATRRCARGVNRDSRAGERQSPRARSSGATVDATEAADSGKGGAQEDVREHTLARTRGRHKSLWPRGG